MAQNKFTVLYTDSRAAELDVEAAVTAGDTELINARQKTFDAIPVADWERCDAIVTARMPIGADAIPHLKKTRIVVRHGVGFDVLDLEALGRAGIAACNVPDYGTTEVADSAIAMMLAFARGTVAFYNALREDLPGGWAHTHNVTAKRLRTACFGVIGFGRIGKAAALRARAFGMDVAFYDPDLPNGTELSFGFKRMHTLNELLAIADVISIHAPLNKSTRGLINAAAVAAMKPGAWVINTARGPICDTKALVEGLKSGKLAAVGLDVLPKEPGHADDPLVAAWQANEPWIANRVILGPHGAWYSPDAFMDLRTKAMETAYIYLAQGKLANCVNEEFLKNRR
jgi:lactate dehydrogenase-like 2-hydroxyacid dehydrogenase